MTQPLIVDPDELNAASTILGKAAGAIPVTAPKLSVPGADPLSMAIALGALKVEEPMVALPGIKGNAAAVAQNIGTAAQKYASTDEALAAKLERHRFPTDEQAQSDHKRNFSEDKPDTSPDGTTPHAKETVPGPHQDDPTYPNGAQATMIPDAKPIPLQDDPPGFAAIPAGPQREQNWRDYLNGLGPDGTRRVLPGTAPAALPNPEAVQDPGLRALGAAGRQQGVSYAWGGNQSAAGPTRGTLAGDPPGGGAHIYADDQRTGFDCGGLVRFSVAEATGNDPFQGRRDGNFSGTDRLDASAHLAPVTGGLFGAAVTEYAQPGDVLIFGDSGHQAFSGSDTHHTGLYVGNGVIINAPSSGSPVRIDPLIGWADEPTDILRIQ